MLQAPAYLHYLLVLSEEREDLLPEELRVVLEELLRRFPELRTLEASFFPLLSVFTLLRPELLLLFLVLVASTFSLPEFLPPLTLLCRVLLLRTPVLLRLVTYTSSLPAGRLFESGRMFTKPKSERRLVW